MGTLTAEFDNGISEVFSIITTENGLWNTTNVYIQNATSLELINCKYAVAHRLYIAYIGVMSVIGVVGNILVIAVYAVKRKASAHKVITISLALSDLSVSSAVIPFEIIEKRFHFSMLTSATCKLWITLSYLFITYSALIIIVLSIDRHRRVCYPFKIQFTSKVAVLHVIAAGITSTLIAFPNALIWNSRDFLLDMNIEGHVCVTETSTNNTDLPTVYNGILLVVSLIIVIYLIVVYASIWKTLLSHVRYINRFKCDSSKRRSSSTTYENAVEHTASCRVTIIAFTVVTVFILSYLPSTVMKLLDTRTEWDIQDTDSTNNHFLHIFARSSCYLNHIANPLIYTMMDSHFRQDCKNIIIELFCFRQRDK